MDEKKAIVETEPTEEVVETEITELEQPEIPPAGTVMMPEGEQEFVYPDNWKEPDVNTEELLLELAADHEARLCNLELGV